MLGAGGHHRRLGYGILCVDRRLKALFLFLHIHRQCFGRVHAFIERLHVRVDSGLRNCCDSFHHVLVHRADVDAIDTLVTVVKLCDDSFLECRRANIHRDALHVLVPVPVEGLDLVGRSKLFASGRCRSLGYQQVWQGCRLGRVVCRSISCMKYNRVL